MLEIKILLFRCSITIKLNKNLDIYKGIPGIKTYKEMGAGSIPDLKRRKFMNKNEIIIQDSPITAYLNVAYPLMLILNNPHLLNWYYEHFINIYSQCWSIDFMRIDFLDSSRFFGDILDRNSLKIEEAHNIDILDFIKENIDSGYCLNVFTIDEYYLSASICYKNSHMIHEILIYGYDYDLGILKVVGYDKKGVFSRFYYNTKEFEEAFKAGLSNPPDYLVDALHKMRLRHFFCDYKFSLNKFLYELKKYLFLIPDQEKKYFSIASNDAVIYGKQVYDSLIVYLKESITSENEMEINYLSIHFFYEHKKILLERFLFIERNYKLGNNFTSLILEYEENVSLSNSIRLSFLKRALVESGFKDRMHVKNKDYLNDLFNKLTQCKNKDEEILSEVYRLLCKYDEYSI